MASLLIQSHSYPTHDSDGKKIDRSFPRMVDLPDGSQKRVANAQELEALLAAILPPKTEEDNHQEPEHRGPGRPRRILPRIE